MENEYVSFSEALFQEELDFEDDLQERYVTSNLELSDEFQADSEQQSERDSDFSTEEIILLELDSIEEPVDGNNSYIEDHCAEESATDNIPIEVKMRGTSPASEHPVQKTCQLEDPSCTPNNPTKQICRHFIRRTCTWGDACRFEHEGPSGRANPFIQQGQLRPSSKAIPPQNIGIKHRRGNRSRGGRTKMSAKYGGEKHRDSRMRFNAENSRESRHSYMHNRPDHEPEEPELALNRKAEASSHNSKSRITRRKRMRHCSPSERSLSSIRPSRNRSPQSECRYGSPSRSSRKRNSSISRAELTDNYGNCGRSSRRCPSGSQSKSKSLVRSRSGSRN